MIVAFSLSIAVIGSILLLLLFTLVRKTSRELSLKRYQEKDEGLADLLNYASVVDEGVIIGKNGAFMAAWLYRGDDNGSSTDAQRELVSFRINQALSNMGNGWMIHVDAVRREAPEYNEGKLSHFPDPLSMAIDEERRRFFGRLGTLYEGYFILTLTWFPPLIAQRKFVELMFDDDALTPTRKAQTTQLIEMFKKECKTFESRLKGAVSITRLCSEKVLDEDGKEVTHDNFLRWLQFCITGLNHPVLLPNNPIYLDALIGGQELWTGVIPKIGRKFIQCVAIEGFPLTSSPGMLTLLAELPIEYRWSSRFIFMDNHEAVAHLEKFRKKWKQKIRGFFDQIFNTGAGAVDDDAKDMVEDAVAAIAETNSGMVAQGYYTSVVVLMDEDRAAVERAALQIEKAIINLGFAARIETINTMDAYLGSLPGHGCENVRRPLLNTMNLADLIPTSTIWTGQNEAPSPLFPPLSPALMHCMTSGNSPFRFNLHVRDLGHGIMFGPTRSGKSTKLAFIAMQWRRYIGARIFAFDKGMSMYPTCLGVGGDHYTIASKNDRLAFAPLQFLETKEDRAWAMEWIDTILVLNGVITTPIQRNEIGNAIISMHQSQSKTMSEFTLIIQDEPIREALKQYTIDGLMGHLVDAEVDGLGLSDFMTFEIDHLMNLGEKFALPVLLYLFRRIEQSLDGRPTLIILDEVWLMLRHIVFRNKIAEWLDTMAKLNCCVFMATQHPSHAVNSGILDVIMESTACKIFLPNPHARDQDTAATYLQMGLNWAEINILATAVPKQDYYYVSEKGRRRYSLALGPLALSFVGATDKESIATIQQLERIHKKGWVDQWLHSKGLRLSDYGVAA
ncbi:MAG: VirB4 family type IV secretion/conjugal transfer ATPase [Tatlockia sp.]|nr:VirB4 family type IV secretion/conjugal transfer ATPase [Tatlockia sp.]